MQRFIFFFLDDTGYQFWFDLLIMIMFLMFFRVHLAHYLIFVSMQQQDRIHIWHRGIRNVISFNQAAVCVFKHVKNYHHIRDKAHVTPCVQHMLVIAGESAQPWL